MRVDIHNTRVAGLKGSLLALVAVGLLAGCANRDSITVGSVPDDYRTNHPIMISEKEEVVDLPVAATDRRLTATQRVAAEGFVAKYDRAAAAPISILVPSGSANELAANDVARDIVALMKKNGISRSRIAVSAYQAGSAEVSAPIRLSYVAMKAHTDKCGRWPEDLTSHADNKHYANFGCSYQNNLAAQIANPADLLGPRKPSDVDAERRLVVIEDYRSMSRANVGNDVAY